MKLAFQCTRVGQLKNLHQYHKALGFMKDLVPEVTVGMLMKGLLVRYAVDDRKMQAIGCQPYLKKGDKLMVFTLDGYKLEFSSSHILNLHGWYLYGT